MRKHSLLVVLGVIALFGCSASVAGAQSPNVLVVVSDDQPYRMSRHLPFLSGRTDFTEFSQAHANTSMCCPARATLLTGLYSHHTQVEDNYQGWRFDASSTLATWLDAAGYETGLFGKYLNRYPWNRGDALRPAGVGRVGRLQRGRRVLRLHADRERDARALRARCRRLRHGCIARQGAPVRRPGGRSPSSRTSLPTAPTCRSPRPRGTKDSRPTCQSPCRLTSTR